ncbi:MAG: histidine ammonia-lyase [Chloroflexi bacterium]|nr:histidine ammonia-lyase [Chloroflexota bacterium]
MLEINGHDLSIDDLTRIGDTSLQISLAPAAAREVAHSEAWVASIVSAGKTVYGINTGFGIFASQTITPDQIRKLNRNLILSHAVGTGPALPPEVVRAAMLIRANTLASGHSGIRLETLATLLEMLNRGVTPEVPAQGSLGSSGDLAPLAHVALVLSADSENPEADSGWAVWKGQRLTGSAAMQAAGIGRVILEAKEGLALTNGATFSAALAGLTLALADTLLDTADVALSMTLEGLFGTSAAFDARLHELRKHAGQIRVAERVRRLTQGSALLDQAGRVQDNYSLRCAPQVQGAARHAIAHAREVIENEINAVTDNPILFSESEAISGGNFHGEPVGMVMDYAKLALAELAAISERRIYHLTDPKTNAGLPPMLVDSLHDAGLNSGMMMPQYTAAALVLENQALAFPNSVQSLPTSAGKEDHNANAMTAARTAYQVAQNCAHVLAVELICAARALETRSREQPEAIPGRGVQSALGRLRQAVPYRGPDSLWGPEIETIRGLLLDGAFRLSEF